jgi:hypothetical protein
MMLVLCFCLFSSPSSAPTACALAHMRRNRSLYTAAEAERAGGPSAGLRPSLVRRVWVQMCVVVCCCLITAPCGVWTACLHPMLSRSSAWVYVLFGWHWMQGRHAGV